MKQLKFLMVAFTLLMGVSFTSCLNDDAGESMYDGIGYVRTVMGSYFIDLYGNTYHPTMASVTEMEAQGFKKIYDVHREDLERERTDDEFMAMYEQYEAFDELEDEFLEKEEEYTALVASYVDEHLESFAKIIK